MFTVAVHAAPPHTDGMNINVLVANRGVPAVRIMHTCRDRKIPTTAVYSTPDRLAYHVFVADTAVHIGDASPINSYLNRERIIEAALASGSNAIHPGWGFLAENADFAQQVIDAGLIWIGPRPEVIRMMGDKIQAKEIARRSNVPTIPRIENVTSAEQISDWMRDQDIAFPIMIKAASGGGGKGMVRVDAPEQIPVALAQARSEAKKSFGNDIVLVEKYAGGIASPPAPFPARGSRAACGVAAQPLSSPVPPVFRAPGGRVTRRRGG